MRSARRVAQSTTVTRIRSLTLAVGSKGRGELGPNGVTHWRSTWAPSKVVSQDMGSARDALPPAILDMLRYRSEQGLASPETFRTLLDRVVGNNLQDRNRFLRRHCRNESLERSRARTHPFA